MLDGDVTDMVEAQSLCFRPQYIDIYLASWGPEDDGATLEGPGPLTRLALHNGIKTVREREFVHEKDLATCVSFMSVSYLLLYIFFKGVIFFFSPNQCLNIIDK